MNRGFEVYGNEGYRVLMFLDVKESRLSFQV
jgi:hypothetical protein